MKFRAVYGLKFFSRCIGRNQQIILEEAKKLAESSGLAGKTIKLHYNTDRGFMEDTALMIQQQLKEIDVTVELEGIDANGFPTALI